MLFQASAPQESKGALVVDRDRRGVYTDSWWSGSTWAWFYPSLPPPPAPSIVSTGSTYYSTSCGKVPAYVQPSSSKRPEGGLYTFHCEVHSRDAPSSTFLRTSLTLSEDLELFHVDHLKGSPGKMLSDEGAQPFEGINLSFSYISPVSCPLRAETAAIFLSFFEARAFLFWSTTTSKYGVGTHLERNNSTTFGQHKGWRGFFVEEGNRAGAC